MRMRNAGPRPAGVEMSEARLKAARPAMAGKEDVHAPWTSYTRL